MTNPVIEYYENGNISSEHYYLNGKYHREDGPAIISYYLNGQIQSEDYCLNGQYHREDGPAIIFYYRDGKIQYEDYYLNDIIYATSDSISFKEDLEKYHVMVKLKSFW